MNAESQSNAQIFQQTRSLQARITLAVIFMILPLLLGWLLWRGAGDDPPLVRWGTRLFVLFIVIGSLSKWTLPVLFPTVLTLSLTDQDVMASTWSTPLHWSEIGQVKVIRKKPEKVVHGNETTFYPQRDVLVFYNRREPVGVMKELDGFSLFENGEELIAALNKRLEQPVTREGF